MRESVSEILEDSQTLRSQEVLFFLIIRILNPWVQYRRKILDLIALKSWKR